MLEKVQNLLNIIETIDYYVTINYVINRKKRNNYDKSNIRIIF